ncbi:stalk domain-containing protein [Paenibacillus allorhizosphaerae]|uniref:stalk domain-containing protein n=1 Tax=Paenibacillus allorhizosphaerae TaxID=2849866 RepID=UPI001C40656B|nr:stalk domain-containing protein [Paenibacillus allorhizosphaerae]
MKKIMLVGTLLLASASIANASGVNGDYNGNPVVKVYYDGTELQPEDVPAINYNGRTMVPIYYLAKLGTEVKWNQETYSVDVKPAAAQPAPPTVQPAAQPDPQKLRLQKEQMLLKDTYKWLSDVDQSIMMYILMLQQNGNSSIPNYYYMDVSMKKLTDQYLEAQQFAQKASAQLKQIKDHKITEISSQQLKLLDQLRSAVELVRNLGTLKDTNQINTLQAAFQQQVLNVTQTARENMDNTNKLIHDLIAKELDEMIQNGE